jgi:hypothetical protein
MPSRWTFGDIIVLRGIWKGGLWWACPVYIVQDSTDVIAIYWPEKTPVKCWGRRPTAQDLLFPQVQLVDAEWTETDVLSLVEPGAAHSIDIMWEAGQRIQRCWYVHLQEPLRRTSIGFDTMDQILDIVISPDQSRWCWKDEDELADAERIGVYSPREAQAIRAEGGRVIDMFRTQASPFCDGWEAWMPPKEWCIPSFPLDWEDVPLSKKDNHQSARGERHPALWNFGDEGISRRSCPSKNVIR